MIIETTKEIELFKQAGALAGQVLEQVMTVVSPGITTFELDELAFKLILEAGAYPTFKGYRNFPASLCVSINEEVVHGIPSKKRILKDGDIVSLDLGVTVKESINGSICNFIGDTAVTVACGQISPRLTKLLNDTQNSLYAGIKACTGGASLDNVGGAIEDIAKQNSYGLVREYGGHGIGQNYHEDPFIFNYRTGSKLKLKPGMVIAVEPMFNHGGDKVRTKSDGWTVVTQDYKFSAHFEHSLLITENAPIVLTKRPGEVIE